MSTKTKCPEPWPKAESPGGCQLHISSCKTFLRQTSTTASHDHHPQSPSPRAREKKPATGVDPTTSPKQLRYSRPLPLRTDWASQQANAQTSSTAKTPTPRSFLETFRSRPVQRIAPDLRPSASRVLNPVNHVPRPTPVTVVRRFGPTTGQPRDGTTLLTLPEQRRSRQNSPTSPVVEHSPGLDPSHSNRTSIGLPSNHQRSPLFAPGPESNMVDLEKSEDGIIREPDKAHVPKSTYNHNTERDLEAGPPSGSILGTTYGASRDDQPLHPPRRIASIHSLRQQQSSNSLRSGQQQQQNPVPPSTVDGRATPDQTSVAEELAWGPAHPCFPHLNSHVPLNRAEYKTTRVIRIRRDWMVKGDLAPTYSNIYPEILDPLMSETEFRRIIHFVNETLVHAFDPYSAWNWLDGLLGLVSGWLWEDLRRGGVKGKLNRLEEWIAQWNSSVGSRDGVKIIPLRRTGYMNLDIQIPDPQIRVVGGSGSQRAAAADGDGIGTEGGNKEQ